MKKNHRIESIYNNETIGVSIQNISPFEVRELVIYELIDLDYPKNLRLGKQVEKIISGLIRSSNNHELLLENIQIQDGKTTIGELDLILKNNETNKIFHLELVYKFYIYDPNYSDVELEKWIGPNRKDSFIQKYNKLKEKQFPLLYKTQTQQYIEGIKVDEQRLCFMASLFVPYHMIGDYFLFINNKTIVGYWVSFENFKKLVQEGTQFCLPQKNQWGIDPKHNNTWESISKIEEQVIDYHSRNFSPLCWIKKQDNIHEQCFIVWW